MITNHTEYRVNDIWLAAFLDLWDVPLVRVESAGPHGSTWFFDNTNDFAWNTATLFRSNSDDQAPIKAFRRSFRRVAHAGDEARKESQQYTDDSRNN